MSVAGLEVRMLHEIKTMHATAVEAGCDKDTYRTHESGI